MRLFSIFFFVLAAFNPVHSQDARVIMNNAVFYDGYAKKVDDTLPAGLLRLRNDLITTKIPETQLSRIFDNLTIRVTIGARCDNYDRMGSVSLAFVPKGALRYHTDSVQRIEIGRFITPFMNMNMDPKTVEYLFKADNIAKLVRLKSLKNNYDFWLELEVFGVPYAANKEVKGCSGRNDVFEAKVEFLSEKTVKTVEETTVFVPIVFKHMLNNYEAGKTDTIGKTVKAFSFDVPEAVSRATIYLITSNHGANENGEEYIRREHFVFLDHKQVLNYIPGGKSCEPYRVHNTQGNGIYGRNPETDSSWASWNNWCPGDTISVREIVVGELSAGRHTFTISVPDAQFAEQQGYFPVSAYVQGVAATPKKKRKPAKKHA